jgi:hypothetical protein
MFCDCKTSSVFAWHVLFLQKQPGPALGIAYLHSIHRGNCNEYRPHESQLQPGPACVLPAWVLRENGPQRITTATRPGVGNRLPAFDPSRELQRVPARSGSQLQTGSACVARCFAIAKPVAFLHGMYCFCMACTVFAKTTRPGVCVGA